MASSSVSTSALELLEFAVEGLRALEKIEPIPVRAPTILTGGNDGGKTSALDSLQFLLGVWRPHEADYTVIGPPVEGGTEPLRVERLSVTGTFAINNELASELGIDGGTVRLRRTATPGSSPAYELLSSIPAEEELRDLEGKKLAELRSACEARGLTPNGKANAKDSWLKPLGELLETAEMVEDWAPAPAALVDRLPRCVCFSSIEEPDPKSQIKTALKAVFDQVLDEGSLTAPIRDAEVKVRDRLTEEAVDLCHHIKSCCPELSEIAVLPEVSFREGLGNIEVQTSRGATTGIALEKSGAGRRRRVNLAIWEWTQKLVEESLKDGRGVVIAYDEPDTHLDYGHQRELATLIQTQCKRPGARMIVATHSLNLIDRVSINDVVHLRLDDERTKVELLLGAEHEDAQRYLADVSAAMGLRNSVLLHERCFVAVEGPTEMQALPLLFQTATGMSLSSAGIALIAGNSNEGALRVAQFLKQHDRRLAFVVDADSKTGGSAKLFRKDKLDKIGIESSQIHYVGAAEIEDLFTDQQWVDVANVEWRRDDGVDWALEDLAAAHLGSKFSSALINIFKGGSTKAPQRKPGYLVALAHTLTQPSEIPVQLVQVFSDLIKLAEEA